MISNEERIAGLTPIVLRLAAAAKNFQLPDCHCRKFFAEGAAVVDLSGERKPATKPTDGRLPVKHWNWETTVQPVLLDNLPDGLWTSLWAGIDHFETSKLGIIRGTPDGETKYKLETAFSARGRTSTGGTIALSGAVDIDWEKSDDEWKIRQWTTRSMSAAEVSRPLFEESLRTAIPDDVSYSTARRSVHHDFVRDILMTGGVKFRYKKEFWQYLVGLDSLDQHPSVSVVDIDRDGWDDFYVTARWGRNQLWRNRGDGTFEEAAATLGLDVDGLCNSSLFADFDNDGDTDVFLGRSLEPSMYLRNDGGKFSEASHLLDAPLPFWVSSMAAADYNGDGLLDLYISTYRLPITAPKNVLASQFLSPDEQVEWKKRRAEDHPIFRLTGPPNVLLVNRGGGRFERAPEGNATQLWLNTFQSTWADYDNDGDPDLFVANDYAPDFVLRNDPGEAGRRRFTDVTRAMAGDELNGFGMGVSLGDYDNDGQQDLFFTYMFSKAGSRITEMFPGLEKRLYEGVGGNKLLRNRGDRFDLVSGHEPSALQVAKTGWSWGGQFADFDNDTFLDLFVSNGYYTPPDDGATEVDL
ncbi:MAG: FG-GAP repeat domain-containing protein [Verrucomicrobiales bacterium]